MNSRAPLPTVHWLTSARRALRASVASRLGREDSLQPFVDVLRIVNGELAKMFEGSEPEFTATSVIVRKRMSGFQRRPDLHILLVEVMPAEESHPHPSGEPPETAPVARADAGSHRAAASRLANRGPRTYIVKLAMPECPEALAKLRSEWNAWSTVRPSGFEQDGMFVALRPFPPHGQPTGLIYSHADQVLGGQNVRSLESVALHCCRFGSPRPGSVERLIRLVYHRLECYFYVQSYVEGPRDYLERTDGLSLKGVLAHWKDRLDSSPFACVEEHPEAADPEPDPREAPEPREPPPLNEEDRVRTRRETLGFLSDRPDTFIDPFDYLQSVVDCPDHGPRVLCGSSHGDVHPRNILVSVQGNVAAGAALIDYESLKFRNIIGWDFVKLETELKVRAYDRLIRGTEARYIRDVHRFEVHLAEQTEELHYHRRTRPFQGPAPLRRLERMILAVRKAAARALGRNRDRGSDWLEEYYFLLAWYGCYAAWFANYRRRMVIAAYVSAGTAARRRYRPWRELKRLTRDARKAADELRKAADPAHDACSLYRAAAAEGWNAPRLGAMTFHVAFEFAQRWVRLDPSAERRWIEAGARLLDDLRRHYPHVVAIEQELVLAHLELGNDGEARKVLDDIDRRYLVRDHESICRYGRYWKSLADRADERGEHRSDRAVMLERALKAYRRAFEVSGHYYPLINAASMELLLGDEVAARQTASRVLKLTDAANAEEDPVWHPATRGEAFVILGEHERAEKCYRRAVGMCRSARDVTSMRIQLEGRVLPSLTQTAREVADRYWTRERLDGVFRPWQNPGDEGELKYSLG